MKKILSYPVLALAFFLLSLPAPGRSAELGTTPDHTYSLWTNINNALRVTSLSLPGGENISQQLKALKPKEFSGKKPEDVLGQVALFRVKMNALAGFVSIRKTKTYEAPEKGAVTPGVLYFNSGFILDTTVLLVKNYNADQLISVFYTRHDITNKNDNDVFAIVDLANRRVDAIIGQGKDTIVDQSIIDQYEQRNSKQRTPAEKQSGGAS